jgi:hypothetical protein
MNFEWTLSWLTSDHYVAVRDNRGSKISILIRPWAAWPGFVCGKTKERLRLSVFLSIIFLSLTRRLQSEQVDRS